MEDLKQALKEARPKLSEIAPLTSAICWGYVAVNLILGLGMIFIYQGTIAPISIASILSYPMWGSLFVLAAVVGGYGLLTNNWKLTRHAQLYGLALKAVWAIALIIRCFEYPQTILITAVWIFFAYIQAATYVYFLPTPKGKIHGTEQSSH